jgi:phosphoribosylanthranilate isomerase
MIGPCTIKVCGITRAADAAMLRAYGADFLGVNVWPGSPRCAAAPGRAALLREIPADARVAVTVNPTAAEARALLAEGFAIVQAHFDPALRDCDPAALAREIGRDRLWLAPKLANGAAFPAELLPCSATFVHDAHAKGAFGGTGQTGDWARFKGLVADHPGHRWVLAGGLGPTNVEAAVQAGARFLDLNSGVESSPGLKSAEKMAKVYELLLKSGQS